MKIHNKNIGLIFLVGFCLWGLGFTLKEEEEYNVFDIDYLRRVYSLEDPIKWPTPELDSLIDKNAFQDIGVLPKVVHPTYNPYSRDKANLGKQLFFDPRLSSSEQIACASCHNPELGWTDNVTRSFGHENIH